MPNWFYTDANGQKQGLINDGQLKALAVQGVVTPQTPLETDTGHKGLAGQIPGLFVASPQPVVQQPYGTAQLVIYRPSAWYERFFDYDVFANGQKLGKVANGQNVNFSVPQGSVKLQVQSPDGIKRIAPVMINFATGQEKKITLRLKKNYWMTFVLLSSFGIVPGLVYALTVTPYVIEEEI